MSDKKDHLSVLFIVFNEIFNLDVNNIKITH